MMGTWLDDVLSIKIRRFVIVASVGELRWSVDGLNIPEGTDLEEILDLLRPMETGVSPQEEQPARS